jgi:hypothetical protein
MVRVRDRTRHEPSTEACNIFRPDGGSVKRLVSYSIVAADPEWRSVIARQTLASIQSLRAHNKSIPVLVTLYSEMPELASALTRYDVSIRLPGSYRAQLARVFPRGAQVLARHPVLHKFLNFGEIDALDPEQLLILDCDTLFFQDVEELFAKYADSDCCAREEHSCRRSARSYDPGYINEELLLELAASEGTSAVPPFNAGVLLLNNKLWRRVPVAPTLISYVWRFSIWMAQHRQQGPAPCHDSAIGVDFLRNHFRKFVSSEDEATALQFPSGNRWIVDEVALWLTLGTIPDLKYRDFDTADVLQGGEILSREPNSADWIVAHYYSVNMKPLASWLERYSPPFIEAAPLLVSP